MNKTFVKRLLVIAILLINLNSLAQRPVVPLNKNIQTQYQYYNLKTDNHISFQSDFNNQLDSVISYPNDSVFISQRRFKWFWRKMLNENFVSIRHPNASFHFNPLLQLEKKKDLENGKEYSINTRGIEIFGNIGQKVRFSSSFRENQAFFPDYIDQRAAKRLVVSGQGAWKVFNESGRDYAMASGFVSVDATQFLNIRLGHGKHFIGTGYRSLLLSDNAFNYPYLQLVFKYKKLRYTTIITELQNFEGEYYYYHKRKHASFYYLSYKPWSFIEVGLFEAVNWRTSDDKTYIRKMPALFYLPVIYANSAINGINNQHNSLIGLNFNIRPYKYALLYGQFAFDKQEKYAWQGGVKMFDVLHEMIQKHQLSIVAEYNYAAPYTYSHTIQQQAYTHYNDELAHPLGSGFTEFIVKSTYKFNRLELDARYSKATTSTDTLNTNFGVSLFIPYQADIPNKNNTVGEKNKTKIEYIDLKARWILNSKTRLQFYVGYTKRIFNSEFVNNYHSWTYFGIATQLNNFYYDY